MMTIENSGEWLRNNQWRHNLFKRIFDNGKTKFGKTELYWPKMDENRHFGTDYVIIDDVIACYVIFDDS